nr:hypothetical protein CFP56_15412 [Quercus suber]
MSPKWQKLQPENGLGWTMTNTIFSPTFHDINQQQSKIMICISQKAHTNKRVLPNIKQDEIKWKFQPLLSEPEFIVSFKTKAYKQSRAKY